MKNSILKNTFGFSIIEAVIGIFICSIIFFITLPSISNFFKFYKTFHWEEQLSITNHLSNDISNLIGSTSIETTSFSLSGNRNIGFSILNTKGVYLNNTFGKLISKYVVSYNTKGDSLYIEIPFIYSKNPLSFKNNFHLYRFVVINSLTKEQSLNYIPGASQGSKITPVNFGKEERIMTNIYDGYFLEEKGGISMFFKLKNGTTSNFFFERTGEL